MLNRKNTMMSLILVSLIMLLPTAQANSTAKAADVDVKAMTIAEIFANKDSLKGKIVRVKGKVVKVSHNIMKLNWIHIKDGTGKKGTDKIIFRSKDHVAEVGSEVIAQGIVDTDLDFGYGYSYSILINDATFSK